MCLGAEQDQDGVRAELQRATTCRVGQSGADAGQRRGAARSGRDAERGVVYVFHDDILSAGIAFYLQVARDVLRR